jgi:murein DD-endopeptidase MepM/ murein hydrolase activator NlpD
MWSKPFYKILFLLVIISPFQLWAINDTSNVVVELGEKPVTFEEMVPAQGIYPCWDTTLVDPYKVNIKDSLCPTYLDFVPDDCGFTMPIRGVVTSRFGWRRGRMHKGIDLDLNTGDSVASVFDGMVRISEYSSSFGYFIVVRHYNGLETLYAHLSRLNVRVGDFVVSGQNLGLGGNTGSSRGSHLHFEVRFLGRSMNPEIFFNFMKGEMKMDSYVVTKKDFSHVVSSSTGRKYHTIRRGETLSSISRRHRTSVKALCRLNRIRTTTIIRAGKRLRVR